MGVALVVVVYSSIFMGGAILGRALSLWFSDSEALPDDCDLDGTPLSDSLPPGMSVMG